MNRIYLDKLSDFTHSTYKNNYAQYNKHINLDDEITKIKQNQSLNEKGTLIKYNYIELANIYSNFEQNELILIYPLCFNVEENIEWYNLLNSLLIILNDDYLIETNIIKKKILMLADRMYKKHIKVTVQLDKNIYKQISSITNINLIIIKNYTDISFFENATSNKWIVCVKHKNDYFPIYNFENKYFTKDHVFIKYLINKENANTKIDEQNVIETKQKEILTDTNINKNNEKNLDAYEEVMTIEDYTLYISEAVEKKTSKKNKNVLIQNQISSSENKKKVKPNKNIFVINDENENQNIILKNPDEQINNIKPKKKVKTTQIEKIVENADGIEGVEGVEGVFAGIVGFGC